MEIVLQHSDKRFTIPRPRSRIVSLGRLMHGTVNRAERNGEEGNDTAFYYWLSTTSVN